MHGVMSPISDGDMYWAVPRMRELDHGAGLSTQDFIVNLTAISLHCFWPIAVHVAMYVQGTCKCGLYPRAVWFYSGPCYMFGLVKVSDFINLVK